MPTKRFHSIFGSFTRLGKGVSIIKVTGAGIILTLKNIGVWLASYTVAGIQSEPQTFLYAFLIYALVTIPSDLYMLNHITSKAAKEAEN